MPFFFRTSPPDAPGNRATRPDLPTPLVAGVLLVGIQGLIGVLLGIAFMVGGVVGGPSDVADAELIGAMALAMGVVLVLAARGLYRGRRAARAPALVWQLIMVGVGFSEIRKNPALAVPLILVGAASTVAVMHPEANGVLQD